MSQNNSKQFRQEYLQEFLRDKEYDAFVEAWTRYHSAADNVDGPHRFPNQRTIPAAARNLAVKAGSWAMNSFLSEIQLSKPNPRDEPERWKKWQRAKSEGLRRAEREQTKPVTPHE